jgi:hypothetical protein
VIPSHQLTTGRGTKRNLDFRHTTLDQWILVQGQAVGRGSGLFEMVSGIGRDGHYGCKIVDADMEVGVI